MDIGNSARINVRYSINNLVYNQVYNQITVLSRVPISLYVSVFDSLTGYMLKSLRVIIN